jgi:hypothetical protein
LLLLLVVVVVVFQLHANTATHPSLCLAADQIHLVAAALAVAPTARLSLHTKHARLPVAADHIIPHAC